MGASESKATSTYSLKETVWEEGNAAGSPFNLYRAVHKTTGQPASVFTYQKAKGSQQSPEDVAELGKAVQRLRTIRHPGIGKFLAADVGDNGLFLAIEPVSPLALTINDLSPEEVCVGIYNILKTVAFLHSQELAHNNIQMDSVFVADGDGRWVLGGMEHVCSFEESSTVKLGKIHLHLPEEYTPPEDQSENSAGIQPDARDAYGLGVLIRALIGPYLKREKPAGSFDWKLLDICAKNLSETAADDRPRIEDVLATEFFENNVFLDVVEKFLKEVRVIDAEVKKERFGELPTDLQELSTQNIVKYVLPLVLNRDMMSEPGADAFYAQLLIPSRENEHGPGVLPVKEYDEHILPFIEEMWRVRSYNVRIVLLQLFHSYITELLNWDGSLLQGMIIPEIILGLDDVDDPLYTLSLCALAPLIEKLCMQTQHSKNIAESQDGFGITLAPSGSNDRRSMGMSGRQLSKEPRREGSAEFKPLPSVVTPPARTVHKLGPWGPGDPPSPMEAPLPSPLSRRLTGGSINNEGSNNLPRARRQSSSNGALDSTTAGNASNKANTANAPSGIPESRYTPQILVENLIIPHTLNVSVMDHMPMEQKWLVIDALIHMWKRLCFIEATNKGPPEVRYLTASIVKCFHLIMKVLPPDAKNEFYCQRLKGDLSKSFDARTMHWLPKIIELGVPFLRDEHRDVRREISAALISIVSVITSAMDHTPTIARKRDEHSVASKLRKVYGRLARSRTIFPKTGPRPSSYSMSMPPPLPRGLSTSSVENGSPLAVQTSPKRKVSHPDTSVEAVARFPSANTAAARPSDDWDDDNWGEPEESSEVQDNGFGLASVAEGVSPVVQPETSIKSISPGSQHSLELAADHASPAVADEVAVDEETEIERQKRRDQLRAKREAREAELKAKREQRRQAAAASSTGTTGTEDTPSDAATEDMSGGALRTDNHTYPLPSSPSIHESQSDILNGDQPTLPSVPVSNPVISIAPKSHFPPDSGPLTPASAAAAIPLPTDDAVASPSVPPQEDPVVDYFADMEPALPKIPSILDLPNLKRIPITEQSSQHSPSSSISSRLAMAPVEDVELGAGWGDMEDLPDVPT